LLLGLLAAASLPARPAMPAASSLGFFGDLASKAAVVSEGFAVVLADLRVAMELPMHVSEMRARAHAEQPAAPARTEAACKESRSAKASL
jgi:hypothetical protein